MFDKAAYSDGKGVGGLEFEKRFETTDDYYIAFISTNPEPKNLDDMIMTVGVSCWNDFPIYENRGITKNFNLSSTVLNEHKNLSLTLTCFTAYYMNTKNTQLYNQGYLFVNAWYTMAGIIYKNLKDIKGFTAPILYTPHKNNELLELCSNIYNGEINGIKFDANTLQKITGPSKLSILKTKDCPKLVAEHPIWIRIDELQKLYTFEEVTKGGKKKRKSIKKRRKSIKKRRKSIKKKDQQK